MAMEAPCKKSAKLTPSSSSSSSCFITNLPNPILMEILCRLPIKTLATSKIVCKSWLHLITDPHFSQLHQATAPIEICFQRFFEVNTTKLYMGNFNSLDNFDPFHVRLNTLFEFPVFSVRSENDLNYGAVRESLYFANSCNGLLCYYGVYKTNRFAAVWNPCTSEFIVFPAPTINKGFPNCRGYGLGFSKKANKFALLRLRGRKVRGSSDEGVVAEICTIQKSCSWKTVGQLPLGFPSFPKHMSSGTFLQSTLHWAIADDTLSEVCIVTYNFEDDQFGRVPLPPNVVKTFEDTCLRSFEGKLGVLAGCLFVTDYTDEGVAIWLMKEYGVQDSWTKLFHIAFTVDEGLRFNRCLPVTYMDNGEILMTSTNYPYCQITVFFYNPVLQSVRLVGSGSMCKVIALRPSLVTLKDSMLGYCVHVKPSCADSKIAHWWTPVKKAPEHCPRVRVNATTSEFPASESSTGMLAHQQGTEELASGTAAESHGKGLMQIPATREGPLERIKTMMEEVLKEVRKECGQRQDFVQDEHAKVDQLKEQIQQSEQLKHQNRRVILEMMDEMRARLLGSR